MVLFERDGVPLSNPSFVKKMQEGNALGLLTGSGPQASIFGGPDSCALTTEACLGSKELGQIIRSLEDARGQKSSINECLYRTPDSRDALGCGVVEATSTPKNLPVSQEQILGRSQAQIHAAGYY
jgi:hypothetical protein